VQLTSSFLGFLRGFFEVEAFLPGGSRIMRVTRSDFRLMSRTLARLLSLDSLLRSGQRQTCSSLATQLEVSERTIRSDIAFLRARFGAPLEYNRRQGHHYTDPDWRLPSVSLSKGDLFALTLGARMLEAYGGSSYGIQLRTAISQLASRLPQSTWVDLQQLAQEHFWFRSGAEIDLAPDIWQRLEDACHTRRSVWMRYYTASRDCISERQFDPYLLHIYRGTNPYAIGRDRYVVEVLSHSYLSIVMVNKIPNSTSVVE